MLRTLNYHKQKLYASINIPFIYSGTFETRSTTSINDHCLFYSNEKNLRIYMTEQRSTVTWSSPLFKQITDLVVYIPKIPSTLWNNLLNIGKNKISLLSIKIIYFFIIYYRIQLYYF